MYMTAMLVQHQGGTEETKVHLHRHGPRKDWPDQLGDLMRMPSNDPGAPVLSRPAGPTRTGRVRAYLDIVAPDEEVIGAVVQGLAELGRNLPSYRNPAVRWVGPDLIAFAVEVALEGERERVFERLSRAVQAPEFVDAWRRESDRARAAGSAP
jgi:hypothetical protein